LVARAAGTAQASLTALQNVFVKHSSFDHACGVCTSLGGPTPSKPLFENDLWHVRHLDAPYGVAGWMMLISQRHVGGPAHFDDREAASFGPTLRHLERVLEDVTGAVRIYTAAMGESHPHFHCHMVPRYAETPNGVKAWGVFDLLRAAGAGEVTVDVAAVRHLSDEYRNALVTNPPPAP
jgi:diadenosine tetraphosphate (Ap4A) HIT family hydrolase